eukprot:scaffold71365_cov22-Prasinocladus_malaysianus.AAC.1
MSFNYRAISKSWEPAKRGLDEQFDFRIELHVIPIACNGNGIASLDPACASPFTATGNRIIDDYAFIGATNACMHKTWQAEEMHAQALPGI